MGKYGILIILIAAIAVFPGCVCGGKDNLAENWGRSYELNKYNQNLNPKAGKNLQPVAGLNGEAAGSVMAGYQKSFKGQGGQSQSSGIQSLTSTSGTMSTPSMGGGAGY